MTLKDKTIEHIENGHVPKSGVLNRMLTKDLNKNDCENLVNRALLTVYLIDRVWEYVTEAKNESMDREVIKALDNGTLELVEFARLWNEHHDEIDSSKCNPACAAAITALARIRLDKLIRAIGEDNILYVDTDSIISLKPAPASFLKPNELGKWSNVLEDKDWKPWKDHLYYATDFYAASIKVYKYIDAKTGKLVVKFKGLSIKTEEEKIRLSKCIEDSVKGLIDVIEADQRKIVATTNSIVMDITTTYSMKPIVYFREKIFDKDGLWVSTLPMEYIPKEDEENDLSLEAPDTLYKYNKAVAERLNKIDWDTKTTYIKSDLMMLEDEIDKPKHGKVAKFILNALRKYKNADEIVWRLNVEGYYRIKTTGRKSRSSDVKALTATNVGTKTEIVDATVYSIRKALLRDEYYWEIMFNYDARLVLVIYEV